MSTDTLSYPRPQQTWFGSCLEVLLPTQCLVCLRPIRGVAVCYRCRPPLPNLSDVVKQRCCCCFEPSSTSLSKCDTCALFPCPADSIRFIWEYEGLARDFIRTMKYRPSLSLLELASYILSRSTATLFPGHTWDIIVPVPQSATNARKRLLHPCLELSRQIASINRVCVRSVLTHDQTRRPQATLSHEDRLRRLARLFTIQDPGVIRDKRVLLVEDVITTGATIAAAVKRIREAGALQIDVIALARTRVWSRFRQRLHILSSKSPQAPDFLGN